MKKLFGLFALSLVLFLSGCSLFPTTTTSITSSTENQNTEPVEVWTVADLQGITASDDVELMADLDLVGLSWVPLCSHEVPYSGTFNGNGHTISNMTINARNSDYNGLFASITGDFNDLVLQDFSINYTTAFMTLAGGLAGELSGDIDGVTVNGNITIVNALSSSYVGLLSGLIQAPVADTTTVAEFEPNLVTNVTAEGTIDLSTKFFAYVGGLGGKSYNSELTNNNVSSTLDVTCEIYRAYVGGLVGHHYGGILIGYEEFVDTTDIVIMNNVALSNITVSSAGTQASIGSLFGFAQHGVIRDNFSVSDITVSGNTLMLGTYIGESWYGNLDSSVAVVTINVTEEENQVLSFNTIAGFANDSFEETTNYYHTTSNLVITDNGGINSTIATLSDPDFYQNTLMWDEAIFGFATLIGYIPV